MAARRPSTACLSCRYQIHVTTRRRIQHSVKRNLQAAALRHDEGEHVVPHDVASGEECEGSVFSSIADTVRWWRTNIPLPDIQEAAHTLEVMVKLKDRRLEFLRNTSKPSPSQYVHNESVSARDKLRLPEAQAAPISHVKYRELMRRAATTKELRQVLRAQLLRVRHPKDLLRVAAVAMQNRSHAEQLAILHEPVMRALYRCRETVTDAEILATSITIVTRLRFAGLVPHYQLLTIGVKFAARARSVQGMKKYLKLVHERGTPMTNNLFRSIIAKFSIGTRGLGEIRNGRWRRADLMQVLTGFEDCKHLPPEQQYHLGVFLDRNDWQYLHGWVAVLARCKASDAVWTEWLMWKQNPARTTPKRLESAERYMDSQWRGDYWFVEQMTHTGDIERAWHILEDTAVPFSTLKDRLKMRLLDGVEHASIWTPEMSQAMLNKYDADLSQIERAFGVTWQPGSENGEGQHTLFRDQEEALDELGANDWKAEEDFGFPTDDDTQLDLSFQERNLHNAAEGAPVRSQTRSHRAHKLRETHDLRRNAYTQLKENASNSMHASPPSP
jgi:hypothetical protein